MKLIDADVMVNVMLFNPEQEEHYTERMTIGEALDLFTEEGCPNPVDRPRGEWKHLKGDEWLCSECGHVIWTEGSWEHPLKRGRFYCENRGAQMRGEQDE